MEIDYKAIVGRVLELGTSDEKSALALALLQSCSEEFRTLLVKLSRNTTAEHAIIDTRYVIGFDIKD